MSQDVPAQKVTAGWDKERIFTVTTETGFDVKMDPGGPKPTEMLLGSLAACAGMTLLDILDKMRLEVTDLEVKAEGKRSEEKPGEFVEFSLIIMIKGREPAT